MTRLPGRFAPKSRDAALLPVDMYLVRMMGHDISGFRGLICTRCRNAMAFMSYQDGQWRLTDAAIKPCRGGYA